MRFPKIFWQAMAVVFIKIIYLTLTEKEKNKRAGPANHSLTTLLQKQGVKP